MPIDKVQQVARGRVWTGADAKDRGLVDELGGFWTAVDDTKRLIGVAPQNNIRFKAFPAQRGLFGSLARLAGGSSAAMRALDGLSALLQSPAARTLLDIVHVSGQDIQMRAVGLPG